MMEERRLYGVINNTSQNLSVVLSSDDSMIGSLNIYTMETGDGREIELSVIETYICWRRVGDTSWIQLIPFTALTPQKGIDYWTTEDREEILSLVYESIGEEIPHHSLSGRDEVDSHPISAITGLSTVLDNKINKSDVECIPAGDIVTVSPSGTIVDSQLSIEEVATITDLRNIVQDRYYVYVQRFATNVWSIAHNMGKMPMVVVKDSAGNTVVGETTYRDNNNLTITFSSAFSGRAYLN